MVVESRNTAVPVPSDALRHAEAIRVARDRADRDRERLRALQRLARRLSGWLDRAEVAEAAFHLGLDVVVVPRLPSHPAAARAASSPGPELRR